MANRQKQINSDTKKLITSVTGFKTGDENFDLCMNFAKSNFKYHRFLTPDSHKVERAIDGVCEKLEVHSEVVKAAAFRDKVTEFLSRPGVATGYHRDEGKTDVHYAILSLLLQLADSPTKGFFHEKVQIVEEEPVDTFDWGNYLLDAEDRNFVSYASSQSDDDSWSDSDSKSDSEEDLISSKGEDVHNSRENTNSALVDEHEHSQDRQQEVYEYKDTCDDESLQLEKLLVVGYWEGKSVEESTAGDHLNSNLIRDWNFYKKQINEFDVPTSTVVVTETQMIRETLWMLSGLTDLFIFKHSGQEFSLNPQVYLMHLTTETLESFLRPLLRKANQVQILMSFVSGLVSDGSTGLPSQDGTTPQTYQAFACCVSHFLSDFRKFLVSKEKEVMCQEKLVTLDRLSSDLRPWLGKLQAVHGVYISGVAEHLQELHSANNCVKATALLDTLYEAVSEQDLLGPDVSGTAVLLLNFLISCSEPMLRIASDWVNYGQLIDPQGEFVLHRNKDVKSLDETFWEKAFISNLEFNVDPGLHQIDSVSSAKTSSSAEVSNVKATNLANQTVCADSNAYPKFLRSILGEVILTGKSMEMLENLGRMGEALELGVGRFERPLSLFDHFLNEFKANLTKGSLSENSFLKSGATDFNELLSAKSDHESNLVRKQLQRQGTNNTLLHHAFENMFLDAKKILRKDLSNQQTQSDSHLTELETDLAMSQALHVCQSCLQPYVSTRYATVCSRLLHILRTEHQLEQCIHAMQRYFLMAEGEVIYDFYAPVFLRIQHREVWKEEELLEMYLHEATDTCHPEDSTRLSVSLVAVPRESAQHAICVTDCIRLKYHVPWPVDTVIDSACQARYNDIFNFLMQIKRAKFTLEQLRFEDLSDKIAVHDIAGASQLHSESMSHGERVHRFQLLRFQLLYFVNSLHTYLMTRILHSTGLELSHDLPAARDLEEVIRVHRGYVERIHDRCLLHPKLTVVKRAVAQVLGLALTCATNWRQGGSLLSGELVLELETELSRCVRFLSSFLNNVIKRGSFPHLESLAFALASSLHKGL